MRYLLMLGLVLHFASVSGQDKHYPPPKVYSLKYDKPKGKDGIRYYLPERPAAVLDSVVNKMIKQDKRLTFFIELGSSNDTVDIACQSFKAHTKIDDLDLLLKNTNRFIISNGIRIPVIFNLDHYYSFLNLSFNDATFYMKFIGKKSELGIVLETE